MPRYLPGCLERIQTMERKNITVTAQTRQDLNILKDITGLNHSKLFAVAIRALVIQVHEKLHDGLVQVQNDISDELLNTLKLKG